MLIVGIMMGDALMTVFPMYVWIFATLITIASSFFFLKPISQSCLLMLATFFLGGWLVTINEKEFAQPLPKNEQMYEAVLTSQPVEHGKIIEFDMIITKGPLKTPMKVKASLLKDTVNRNFKRLNVGDGITAISLLEKPNNFYQSSNFDYVRWLQCHGYKAKTFIYYNDWQKAVIDLGSLSHIERTKLAALKLRQKLLKRYINNGLQGQQYAVVAAMTLGDKSFLSKRTKDVYSISGASHVLALSGLHLSIIYAILTMLTFTRRRQLLSQTIIISVIWIYVFMVGMPLSVIRSALMLTVYSMFSLFNRDKMSLNVLALTAMLMLFVNPMDLFDVGFQMSFMAVMSIMIYYRSIYELFPAKYLIKHRVINWIWSLAVVSISAQIGTAPLVAYYFGRFSCYFLFANYLVIPLATMILYGSVIIFILTPLPIIQSLIVKIVGWFAYLLNHGLQFISSLPFSSVEGINVNVYQIFIVYIIIASISVLAVYTKKMYYFTHYKYD
jgi:competence protein ComEC